MNSARRRDSGAALIVALFALVILTALAVVFTGTARTDVLLAGTRAAQVQALRAAQSGIYYGRTLLAEDDPDVDSTDEDWALAWEETPPLDIPGYTVEVALSDESGRLNVNTATSEMLLALPGMTEEAADSILDWRDSDDEPRAWGVESDYYESLASPYDAANEEFQTLDELRLVRGVTQAIWEGDGTEESPGLRDLITVRSGEANSDSEGMPRLNINTAGTDELSARLGDLLGPEAIASLERRRRSSRLTSLGDTLSVQGVPWQSMALALDRICLNDETFVEGTVNVNTASQPVLEAVGLPSEAAQAIIERRADEPFKTKGELADLTGVDQDVMRAVADVIATKSSVFRVTARAQPETRPLASAVVALLDRSADPAGIILWREVFGDEARTFGAEEQGRGA